MIRNSSKLNQKQLKITSISGGIKVNFSSPFGLTVFIPVIVVVVVVIIGVVTRITLILKKDRGGKKGRTYMWSPSDSP